MPFFSDDHLAAAKPAVGRPSGFFDNIAQGYRQQYRVDSPYSLEDEVKDRWQRSLDTFRDATGETYSMDMSLGSFNSYARTVLGEDVSRWQQDIAGGVSPELEQNLSAFQAVNSKIKELNNPDIQSFEQVLEEVIAMQHEVEEETSRMAEMGGVRGAIGQFIGATAGTFSTRDPLTLATLGIGGLGRTIAARIASEIGLASGVTALTEYGAVQPNRELAGLPDRNPLYDVLVAGAGAGALQGVAEGVGRMLSRRREARQLPERETQVREALEQNTQLPEARAALELLDADAQIRAASPYGEGHAGLRRFTAELEEVARVFGGQAETAIVRALPQVPFEQLSKAADFQLVRERSPEIYGRMEQAQAAVSAIDGRVTGLETQLQSMDLPGAVRLVDEEAAAQLDEIQLRLDEAEAEPEVRALEAQSEAIIQRVGVDRVAKALEEAEIAPRQELRTLRGRRRAANRRFKRAYGEVEAERGRLQAEVARLEDAQRAEASDLLGHAFVHDKPAPMQGQMLNYSVIKRRADFIDENAAEIDNRATALVESFDSEAGRADIGLPEDIDLDMRFVDGDGRNVSFREVLEELAADRQLDEAVRTCAL